MKNCFNVQKKRRITESNINLYINPYPHPDRIMQEHDFFYLWEGGWVIGQNGRHYKLSPDDVLILPAGEHHYGVSDTLPQTRTIYIHTEVMEGDFFSDTGCELPGYICLDTQISCRGYDTPKKLFNEISFEFWAEKKHNDIKISALFDVLLYELSLINNNRTNYSSNNLMNELLYIIHSNPQKFYKISELAAIFFVSEKTIVNMFIRHTGISAHEYQLKKKIEIIKTRMKSEPNIKIKDFSKEYGFYDEFHLSRVFKKYAGVSPKDYKKILSGIQ